ncbi:hypothetical protein ABEB36_001038 [Hypothenemus hampei]|uniref:Motile sperm domain-containing protein 2 n=1 Tax=Hypothenemus hampei TaxID=57062 RepID=A0ABD1FDA5_HYPHA
MAAAVPQSLVDELRSTFLNELKEKGEESIDSRDLVRVKNDNFWLQRFLAHHEHNIPLALKMMWVSLNWRKEFGVNDITEQTIKMDLIVKGAFFPCGKDKDGKTLLIIKSKMHTKGAAEGDDLKRCIVYWLERTERMTQGDTISVFFDMDGCGLGNMDLDLIKYLIGLFKDYYPYFLNYIIIYEMAWVLSAAFKLIKSWLPEKAIEKLKTVGKKDVMNWVIKSEALKSWGGDNDYVFSFVPEDPQTEEKKLPETANTGSVRKVHFSDGVPMSESTSPQEIKEDGPLDVTPSTIITFVHEGNELVSTLELRNIDSGHVAFKLKTTSPEKFKVRPSTGILAPGAKESITVTLLPGYQLGGLSKDKFLVLSSHLESQEVASLDLSDFWKVLFC